MKYCKLGDICNPKQWKTLSKKDMGNFEYPVYGANGIIGYFSEYNHIDKTLLIGCRGTCGTVTISKPFSYINGNAMALDNLCDEVIIDYLFYFLKNRGFKDIISGSSQPQIIQSDISKINIFFPEIKIQQQTVNKLNKVSLLINNRRKQHEKLDLLVKSRFVEMFENSDFPIVAIKDIVDTSIISAKKRYLSNDCINYIDISSIDNINNNIIEYSSHSFTNSPSRAQWCIELNDILVATVRPGLKNIAQVLFDTNNFVASSGFCVLRAANKCIPEYLREIVLSDNFTKLMIKLSTGANYPAIKNSDVLNYKAPLPPLQLQNQFADFAKQVDKSKFEFNL